MAVQIDTSLQGLISRWSITRHDAARLRHALTSDSIIDWRRLYFESREEVDRLLRLNLVDPGNPDDLTYLRRVHAQACEFLTRQLSRKVPQAIARPEDPRDLFLLASGAPGDANQAEACMILKVMNIVHHLNARDLQFRAPVSERDLALLAHARVSDVVSQMRSAGLPIADFQGGTKPHDSLLLKLLAKPHSLAAQVYDKVRYRLTVPTHEDIVRVIVYLFENLAPFNYVIPGQSRNDLIDLPPAEADGLLPTAAVPEIEPPNEFSGPGFEALNFIVDLPLRLDDYLDELDEDIEELGRVMFVMVEFQIFDQATAKKNEAGENRHALYKDRQRARVLARLNGQGPKEGS